MAEVNVDFNVTEEGKKAVLTVSCEEKELTVRDILTAFEKAAEEIVARTEESLD